MGAGLFDRRGGFVEIIGILRIDRALPGDDEQFLAQGDAAETDAMTREVGAPIHQLERRLNAIDAIDVTQALETIDHQLVALVADDRINGPHGSDDGLNLATELRRDGGHFGELFRRETVGLRKNHGSRKPILTRTGRNNRLFPVSRWTTFVGVGCLIVDLLEIQIRPRPAHWVMRIVVLPNRELGRSQKSLGLPVHDCPIDVFQIQIAAGSIRRTRL